LCVLALSNNEPDVIIQTTPTEPTITTLPSLEETPFAVPSGALFAGSTSYRGDSGRSGVIPDVTGVSEAEGYYWRYTTADQVVASPVPSANGCSSPPRTGRSAVDMTTGQQLWTFNADRLSPPTVLTLSGSVAAKPRSP
jgi:hypothetical protein